MLSFESSLSNTVDDSGDDDDLSGFLLGQHMTAGEGGLWRMTAADDGGQWRMTANNGERRRRMVDDGC